MNDTRYSKDPRINKSLRHSLKDAVAFSVMSGGLETYFSAFALFLKATAAQIALLATLPNLFGSLAQLISAWLGHRINQRKLLIVAGAYTQATILLGNVMGNRLMLMTTGSIIPFLPAMWVWTGNFWYLMLIQVISGFCWAGFSLSAGNIMYELIPKEKRATYQALQSVVMTLGVFCGSMLGVLVTDGLPAQFAIAGLQFHLAASLLWALLLSSAMRILVAVIFLPRVQEVRKPRRKISPYQLVFRFTRFNAFSGLLYDIVTKVQSRITIGSCFA